MMELKAVLDEKFGKYGKCLHYVIGKPGDAYSGGLYIVQGNIVPETITIKVKGGEEDGQND
jgi:hypothetical protein